MTNHYIVNATTREIWQDIPEPEQGLNEKRAYESRLRFPYSTELNWRDGQRVEVNVHFQFGWTTGRKDNVDDGHQFQIAIPIKEKGKYMCSECDTLYDNINDGCPKCSQPLPSKDKEEKTERMFTITDMLDYWAACVRHITDRDNNPDAFEYLQQTFGIDISNK